jgi:hypothetical protein
MASGEVVIRVRDDFGILADEDLPPLGSASRNLKISHEQWSGDGRVLTLSVAGIGGLSYDLKTYGAVVRSVEGGSLSNAEGAQAIKVSFPGDAKVAKYESKQVVLHF